MCLWSELEQAQRTHGSGPSVGLPSGFVSVKETETLVLESTSWMLRVGGVELGLPAQPGLMSSAGMTISEIGPMPGLIEHG